jgi:hypothetical protein
MSKNIRWRLCRAAAITLAVLSFSPLVIPPGRHEPMLWGMPYTLWMGILMSMALVGLAWLGARVHPGREE